MPLRKGNGEADISANIAELVRAGHPQKQAEAIAYRVAGKDCAALDMSSEEWNGLLGNLIRFFGEEMREPEHQGNDAEDPSGKLSNTTRKEIGREGSEHREEEPEGVFLEPKERKYPVKVKRDGEYKYDRNLLLAAAREARMHGHEDLAKRADEIRKREFGSAQDAIALDRDSVREKDADGRLHVKTANLSKATINPYYGREIPRAAELGLEPGKLYYLLRHPDELKKAARTFNGIPVQIAHKPTSAEDHQTMLTVGATGNEAAYDHPFLKNSLVIWPEHAIEAIENGSQRELSCGYKYDADMTPGEYEGQKYDGVMRNIVGNHVALVESGRAGPEVVVGDSALGSATTHDHSHQEISMGKHVLTRKAAVAQGAVLAHLKPLLAADAAIDLGGVFVGVTSKNLKEKRQAILDALKPQLKLKAGVAMDAALKAAKDALEDVEPAEVEEGADIDPNSGLPMTAEEMREKSGDAHPLIKELEGKVSPEIMARIKEALGEREAADEDKRREGESDEDYVKRIRAQDAAKARDASPEKDKPETVTKEAMDAAIAAATRTAQETAKATHDALVFVEPWVGRITQAHDSAEGVYRAACGMLGVKVDDVKDPAALKHIISAQPKVRDRNTNRQPSPLAADAAASKSFGEMFPGADRIGRAA